MNRFLVVGFDYNESFYYSLILCKTKKDHTEYRITIMNGEIEKQLCNNNIIKEINDCLLIELFGNSVQNQLKTVIARQLGKIIGKTVNEVAMPGKPTGEISGAKVLPTVQADSTIRGIEPPG